MCRTHLIDILEPTEDFNVVRFQALPRGGGRYLAAEEEIPIVASGDRLYIQALLNDIDFTQIDENTPSFGRRWNALAAERGRSLHERLRAVDPESAGNPPKQYKT